jgi:DNA-binding protein H-NS
MSIEEMSIADLIKQKEELEKQIASMRKAERETGIKEIRERMAALGITVDDLQVGRAGSTAGVGRAALRGTKIAAKYRNAATGQTWSGRGLKPRWLDQALTAGAKLEDFAVA